MGENFAQIRVVGVGGGGSNAVNRMIAEGLQGVDFIAVNTDAQALMLCNAPKLLRIGDGAYIFSLVLLSSLLAIFVVPAWLALLGPQFGTPLELAPTQVAWVLAKSFLLPLAAGMLVRWWLPAFAERWASRLIGAAGTALTVCALTLLVLHFDVLLVARWGGVLALMALVALALAIGHLLGGPAHDDRTALAVACASRHIGIAVLVAASLPGPGTAVIIAVYIVASAVVCIPYLRWRRAVAARTTSPSESTHPQGVRS